MPWQTLLEIAAAVNCVLLALTLLVSPRLHRTRARVRLAGFLFCVAWLLTTFALVDQSWLQPTHTLVTIDHSLSLLLPALFADYVAGSLRRRGILIWAYLPSTIFLVAALIGGATVLRHVRIEHLVMTQMVYTVAATVLFARPLGSRIRRPHHLVYLLAGMWLIHVAQVTRALRPDVGWVFDAVPLVGTAFILGLTILIFTDSRTLRAYTREPDPSPGPSDFGIAALDHLMRTKKPFLDPGLKVEGLAQIVGIPSRELSKLINRHTGANFYEYVNRHRVTEAQRLLTEPAEIDTSVEAVGLLVGFRARSTFYEAFRRVTGQTPAEYRRAHLG